MKRHALSTRIWHWVNLVCVVILFMSGLNISNAHPRLYWGNAGFAVEEAWLIVPRFPGWMTIPDYYDLAAARDWHVLMAWPFALGLAAIWMAMLANGHFWRDLRTRRSEWTIGAIRTDIVKHLHLDFSHNDGKFNFLQRLAYGIVFGVILPAMVLTGLAISPGFEPVAPWLVDLLGGRQSARSLHFLAAFGLAGFLVVHVVLVALTGPVGQLRAMVTGGSDTRHRDAA